MRLNTNKKNNVLTFYILLIVALSLLMIMFLFKLDRFLLFFQRIIKILAPIIWGFVIAYLLNPIMILSERTYTKLFCRKKPHKKAARRISVAFTMLFFLLIISLFFYAIVPEIARNISSIFKKSGNWINDIQKTFNNILEKNPKINDFYKKEFDNIIEYLQNYVENKQPGIENFVSNVTKGALNFLIGIKDFILGLIVSVYLLLSKENLLAQIKKMTLAIFPKRTCQRIFNVYHKSNKMFIGFISGKIIDSIIIGILCFIIMRIIGINYSVLISLIIGVTNIIPFFGPFIGAIPSAMLVFFDNPRDVIPFLIFILILQQFDGNILGPRILGDSTGLPAFWVLFAIFLGGGLFGFTGMLLGVPTFALIYALFRDFVENKLKRKRLPTETKAYYGNVEKYYEIKRAKDKQESADYDEYMISKK